MSNLEADPDDVVCDEGSARSIPAPARAMLAAPAAGPVELLEPRDVPLGGPRAMEVRRTLPQRARSLIGAWCFVDHYGPDLVARTHGMVVPPHPHTGLQTVSWLFAGEIEHRDSTGAHAMVRPGELNLMTAGRGIQHSEVSTTETTVLHGAQLWVALPDSDRHTSPFFEHYAPVPFRHEGATVHVFVGTLLGDSSPATTFSPLVGAQLDIPAHTTVRIPVEAAFEHGILVDSGMLHADGAPIPVNTLGYLFPGRESLLLEAGDEPVRALLIGGAPLGESIVMWWNFIGRSHEEIVAYRTQWQAEMFGEIPAATSDSSAPPPGGMPPGRFGHVEGYPGPALPAPVLPNVRLRPRD